MTIGNRIASARKQRGITQEALAQRLGVTNQAVSKWESDQCCPDVMLLPKLADIFNVSLDALFGREVHAAPPAASELPWPDDDTLRVAIYVGRELKCGGAPNGEYAWEEPVGQVLSRVSVRCGPVNGDVNCEGDVSCGDVMGNVSAGESVNCGNILGHADAGENISCDAVEGNVDAGGDVTCGGVGCDVDAGGDVACGNVGGDVDAGGDVTCGDVMGDVDAGGDVRLHK